MAKKTTQIQRPNRGAPQNDGKDYLTWLQTVPESKRKLIATFLRKNPIRDYDDVLSFSQFLLAELVMGNMTPVIAREARAWVEFMFTIVATKNNAMGTPGAAYTDIISALISVKREVPQLTPSYESQIYEAEAEEIKVTTG